MMGKPKTDCALARRFLDSPDPAWASGIADHLADCPSCQAAFEKKPQALQAVFAGEIPLPPAHLIAQASQRLQLAHQNPFPNDQIPLPIPHAPGFSLGAPIRRTNQSQVFLATQTGPNREVVVKFVSRPASFLDYQLLAREGNILAALKHPNILTVYQTGRWAEGVWMALEYCPNGSLSQVLDKKTRLDAPSAAQIIKKMAQAVAAAHRYGFIHNDIKPGNILIDNQGEPRLADFGLAIDLTKKKSASGSQSLVGTPRYMAPEQVRGGPPDIRTDVHALGSVLYHLLTGSPACTADSQFQVMLDVAHKVPTSPDKLRGDIPPDLAAICMKCLAKDPEARYQTAEDLAEDLIRFQAGFPVLARKTSRWESTRKWAARNKATALAGSLTIFMLLFSISLLAFLVVMVGREKQNAIKNAELITSYLDQAEAQAYSSGVQAAMFEMEEGSTAQATDLLSILPFNSRCWEHNYITGRLRQNQVTLLDHGNPVLGLAIHPDGSEFVSVSSDRTVRLWDGAKAVQRKILLGGSYPFVNAVYSSDGRRLAVLDASNRVRILDTQSGVKFPEIQLPQKPRTNEDASKEPLAFSQDGSLLYAQDNDHRVTAWHVESGTLGQVFNIGHSARVNAMVFSPDSHYLVTAGEDKKILVWNPAYGCALREIKGHERGVRSLAFSTNGKVLASAGKDKFVKLWRFETGQLIANMNGHEDWINSLAFNPAGTILASASDDHTIRLWNVWEGTQLKTFRGHTDTVKEARFSSDGKLLLSASSDKTIKLWNPAETQGLGELRHNGWVRSVTFNRDGSLIASIADDNQLRLWSANSGANLKQTPSPIPRATIIRFSPDGERLIIGSRDKNLYVFAVKSLTLEKTVTGHGDTINAFCFTPDGTGLFTASTDNTLIRWDTRDWRQVTTLRFPADWVPGAIAISPDARWLAVSSINKAIQIIDTTDWSVRHGLKGCNNKILDLAFSPDGKLLAEGGEARVIRLWDIKTGKMLKEIEGHSMPVTSVGFSPDGQRLLSGSFDRTIRLWNTFSGKEILRLNNHRANVRQANFSPDGQWIASAGDDHRVLLWDGSVRMEYQKIPQFKTLTDLKSIVDSNNRAAKWENDHWFTVNELLDPKNNKGLSISRDGDDYIILDRKARATRLAREQALLATWK